MLESNLLQDPDMPSAEKISRFINQILTSFLLIYVKWLLWLWTGLIALYLFCHYSLFKKNHSYINLVSAKGMTLRSSGNTNYTPNTLLILKICLVSRSCLLYEERLGKAVILWSLTSLADMIKIRDISLGHAVKEVPLYEQILGKAVILWSLEFFSCYDQNKFLVGRGNLQKRRCATTWSVRLVCKFEYHWLQ